MSGDVGAEVAAVLAEPLCRAICDLLGEPRILVPGEVLALLSRPPVADALAPLIAERVRAAKAEALREAADHLRDYWVKEGRHYGAPGCYTSGHERWLRDRAAALDPGPRP